MDQPDRAKRVTEILTGAADAAADEVARDLMPLVYDDLRELAGKMLQDERRGHTLQPTALVHETYMRLVDQSRIEWQGRTHFLAIGAAMMRRILVDHGRTQKRAKRGGGVKPVALEDNILGSTGSVVSFLDLQDAMDALARLDELQARIVELRFFGGLTVQEVADHLGVSKRKVEGEWTHAKAWLLARLDSRGGE